MDREPSTPLRRAPTPVVALIVVVGVGLGVWWIARRAADARVERAIVALAPGGLPAPDDPVQVELADLGAQLFRSRCSACHAVVGETRLGPNLAGVTLRRRLPWIRSMLLRPDSMTREDADAKILLQAYGVRMKVPGRFGPAQARAVIEFLRRVDSTPR